MGLTGFSDPDLLEWATHDGRILLTHDVQTMAGYAYARVANNLGLVGVFEIPRHIPIAIVIEELVLIIECGVDEDWIDKVTFLPL
jgi:hypothetical protein